MESQDVRNRQKTLWRYILGYSLGQIPSSLTMSGIYAFAMLYYTQALGLSFALAGLAFAVSSIWDAFVDPLIGHLSDNTHSRWGRRHAYILFGGMLMAACFYYLWFVPISISRNGHLFVYLLFVNILYRTAYAVYSVPYGALGFEVCTDYHQRSQLQSTGLAVYQLLANLLGVGLGWSIFFPDSKVPGGPEATSVISNFLHMGLAFSIVAALFVVVVVLATRRYISDTRGKAIGTGNSIGAFYRDSREIISDKYMRWIIIFLCTGMTGAIFVATLQMYLYVYFLHLTALQKTIIHGGGMVLCGVGALLGSPLARRFDKKLAVCMGASIAGGFDLLALVLYLSKTVNPTTGWMLGGHLLPLGIIIFGACDMINWLGVGIYQPLASSMLADVSEVNDLHSGVRKDGGYSAIFAFITKLIMSLSTFIASASLAWVGFREGSDQQTPEAIHWLVMLTFGLGSLFAFLVIPLVLQYPIDRAFMTRVKKALAEKKEQAGIHPQLTTPLIK